MPRFRFKIVDSQGRRRSGVLRADSLEIARGALLAKLCQVIELTPLSDDESGSAVELARLESSFVKGDRIRAILAVAFTVVSLGFIGTWVRSAKPTPRTESPTTSKVDLVVMGKLQTGALSSRLALGPSELKVYAVLPDLVYEEIGQVGEDGSFQIPLSLLSRTRAKTLALDVELEDERWTVLPKKAIGASNELDLGVLVVSTPPKHAVENLPTEVAKAQAVDGKAQKRRMTHAKRVKVLRAKGRKNGERRG